MSSLSLLDNGKGGSTESVIMCTPALATLLIGAVVVMYDIVTKRPGLAGYHLMITIGVTIAVLLLCMVGMPDVGTFIVLFPIVIFAAIVVIILLALMIGSPREVEVDDTPHIVPEPTKTPDHPHKIDSSYKYVMTGKGFGFF